MSKAARAFGLTEFYTAFNEIKNINASCAEYLIGIGFEHWARAHFPGNRYNIMTSNVAETWNSVLREAREYPITALVEYIRVKLMNWFAERRNVPQVGNGRLTVRVKEIVEENFQNSGGMLVRRINDVGFEVKDKDGCSYHVNLATKSCSCYSFQKLLIPCSHALASAIKEKVSIESLVSDFYTVENLSLVYGEDILPISNEGNTSGASTEVVGEAVEIFPPSSRRPPGRPRKSRILSTGEIRVTNCTIICFVYISEKPVTKLLCCKMKTPRKRHVCSRCNASGHNKATCKVAI